MLIRTNASLQSASSADRPDEEQLLRGGGDARFLENECKLHVKIPACTSKRYEEDSAVSLFFYSRERAFFTRLS